MDHEMFYASLLQHFLSINKSRDRNSFQLLHNAVRFLRKSTRRKKEKKEELPRKLDQDWQTLINGTYYLRYFPTCYPFFTHKHFIKTNEEHLRDQLLEWMDSNDKNDNTTITEKYLTMIGQKEGQEFIESTFDKRLYEALSFSKYEIDQMLKKCDK